MSESRIVVIMETGFFRVVAQREPRQVVLGVFEPQDGVDLEHCRQDANRFAHSVGDILGVPVHEFPVTLTVPRRLR